MTSLEIQTEDARTWGRISRRSLLSPTRLGLHSSSSSAEVTGRVPSSGCRPQVAFLGRNSAAFASVRSGSRADGRARRNVLPGTVSRGIYPYVWFISKHVCCWHAAEFCRCSIVLFAIALPKLLCARQVVCDLKSTEKAPCPRGMHFFFFFFFNILWFSSLTAGASALPEKPLHASKERALAAASRWPLAHGYERCFLELCTYNSNSFTRLRGSGQWVYYLFLQVALPGFPADCFSVRGVFLFLLCKASPLFVGMSETGCCRLWCRSCCGCYVERSYGNWFRNWVYFIGYKACWWMRKNAVGPAGMCEIHSFMRLWDLWNRADFGKIKRK